MTVEPNPSPIDGQTGRIEVPTAINRLAALVVDRAVRVHRTLGPGLLESVYERCLEWELLESGLHVQTQLSIPIRYRNICLPQGFRADIYVQDSNGAAVLLELKSVEQLEPIHRAQLLTYLRQVNLPIGLLINFNHSIVSDGIERLLNRHWRPHGSQGCSGS